MSRETVVVCPSGLEVRMRSMKGKDLDVLRDKKKVGTGESTTSILNACTLEVLNRSIYEKLPSFNWADCLIADRMRAVIGVRVATSGADYTFRVRCSDQDCKAMIHWSLDLDALPVKELPESSKQNLMNGAIFSTTIAGTGLRFKLATGRDQLKLVRLANELQRHKGDAGPRTPNEGRTMLGLAQRIVSIDGQEDITGWLSELYMADLRDLLKEFEAVDGGVETGIEIICSECGMQQEVELPLDRSFFGDL
jgi:hypothetical protein